MDNDLLQCYSSRSILAWSFRKMGPIFTIPRNGSLAGASRTVPVDIGEFAEKIMNKLR